MIPTREYRALESNELQICYQADKDLARRANPGIWIYITVYCIILALSPYWRDSPQMAAVFGILILLNTLIRTYLVVAFERLISQNRQMWFWAYCISTLLSAVIWAALVVHTLYLYELEWNAMLMLLTTVGISSATMTTLAIRLRLILFYLTITLIPVLISTAIMASTQSIAIMSIFMLGYFFLIVVSIRVNQEYWTALKNTFLLDQRAQDLQFLNDELESFAYSVSHDLRAPLRSIDGFAHALLEELDSKLDDTNRDYFNKIRKSSQKMGQLIDDILQLSRITRTDLKIEAVNLTQLAHDSVAKFKDLEPDKNLTVTITDNMYANGDPILLSLLVDNLVSNAYKYTSHTPHAEIVFGYLDKDSRRIYFIKDNGVGFDMQYVHKVFTAFQRLHKDSEFPGTGVGLAIVLRILERHKGKIWAEAGIDKGATFYFTLGTE